MFFDKFLEDLGGEPKYHVFPYHDVNPLGGYEKKRLIHAPNEPMRRLHERMIGFIRHNGPAMPYSGACRPGDSPLKNVARHRQNRFFYLIDLHGAYQDVVIENLADILCLLTHHLLFDDGKVIEFLVRYFEGRDGGVATGGSASPDLFNLYAHFMIDEPMAELVQRYGLTYSRYLDDLTFSALEPIGKNKRAAIRKVVEKAGFSLSFRKCHVLDLQRGTIAINGICLDRNGRLFLAPWYRSRIKMLLRKTLLTGMGDVYRIAGMMGLFGSTSDRTVIKETPKRQRGRLTRAERKIFDLYAQYQAAFERGKIVNVPEIAA